MMTGDEIIKILEENTAEHLAVYMSCHTPNGIVLVSPADILDFINRKNAEIERLKKLLDEGEKKNEIFAKRFYKEGVKDLAERLISVSHPYANTQMVFELQIRNIAKELAGDTE